MNALGKMSPTHAGPVSYQEMQTEVQSHVRDLAAAARAAQPADAGLQESLRHLEDTVSLMQTWNAAAVKRDLRAQLWALRCHLAEGPEATHTALLCEKLEQARGACLDISWERSMGPYPSSRYTIRPSIAHAPNYGEVTNRIIRGGQTDQEGAEWLMAHGVTTEIDLRGSDYDNQWASPRWGPNVKHYRIAIEDMQAPSIEQVEEFGRIVGDPASGKVYVHCKAGIGRTSAMLACWRITQGMTAEEALASENFFLDGASLAQEQYIRQFERDWKARRDTPKG